MLLLFCFNLSIQSAIAWENHQAILERLLETQTAGLHLKLNSKIKVPALSEEQKEITSLGISLDIDASKVPLVGNKNSREMKLSEFLKINFIDEPDLGMDQNRPEASDPNHFRKWMGGFVGPTSQGFRHMYFKGVEWTAPLATFQIPLHAVGEAIDRIEKLRAISDAYFLKGESFWGYRTLLWELHYLQDLEQPFHVIQAPSLKMLAWNHLWKGFIKSSTHSIANYHYAYEGLIEELLDDSSQPDFQNCLDTDSIRSFENAKEILTLPRKSAASLGLALIHIFGTSLKSEEINLPAGEGELDYFSLLHASKSPETTRDELKELTDTDREAMQEQKTVEAGITELKVISCNLMREVGRYTLGELERAQKLIAQNSTSSKTGK